MGDCGVGIEVVHPHKDAVVLAARGLARGCAEDGVDDRAIRVINDSKGIGDGRGCDVGGLRDLAGGVDEDVCAVDIFVQRALVSEGDAGSGNGGPQGSRGIDHGGGLLV